MNWFVHDGSLCGQYPTGSNFIEHLTKLLKLRSQSEILRNGLRCSRLLRDSSVCKGLSFSEAVQAADPLIRRIVLEWINTKGPFWEDNSVPLEDDYFQCQTRDVTLQSLAEAVRFRTREMEAFTFSFSGGNYDYTPIVVQHGIDEDPIGTWNIDNFWELIELEKSVAQSVPTPLNWTQVIDLAKDKFPNLRFSDDLMRYLEGETYSSNVAKRALFIFQTLQDVMSSRDANRLFTKKTQEIIANHFTGEKALFTDESDTNKEQFKNAMTFDDPNNPGHKRMFSWHGKIKTPQYRVHFSWPLVERQEFIDIVYIGPKITKS